MPMNEYGEIIRNSSPPPPIPPINNNRNSNNGPTGSGIAIVIGIAILVAVIWFIVNANKNKENTNYVDTDSATTSDYSQDYTAQESSSDEAASDDTTLEYYDTNDDTDSGIEEYNSEEYDSSSEETLSNYILPYSDSEYISYSDLDGLSQEQVMLARNEIYARRGRKFTTESIKNYFESKSWYAPQYEPDDFPDSIFNEYEKENIKTIVAYETEKGWK